MFNFLSFLVTTTDEDDSEGQDEDMKSQHNHSAYSLVMVDTIDEPLSEEEEEEGEKCLENASPKIIKHSGKSCEPQTITEDDNQIQISNSNEADDTLTNTNSGMEPATSPDNLSNQISGETSVEATPRSNQSSEPSSGTPRSGVRRSGLRGCYSFRALPRTPSGTPRGMRAYIRSHTFPKGEKRDKDDEEELSEYWDQVRS